MQCHVIAVGRPIRRVRNAAVHCERADHAHVHVGHVEGRQPVAHGQRRQRVDRQVPGQPQRHPVHGDPVDHLRGAVPLAVRARGGREDLHVVSAAGQLRGEVVDLHLDAAEPRQVAVRQQGDLHRSEDVMGNNGGHMGRTLVAFHAHPDDEALLTSGTMARAAAEGHRVVLVVATDGGLGLAASEYVGASDTTLGSVRMAELRDERPPARHGARRDPRVRGQRARARDVSRPARPGALRPRRPGGGGGTARRDPARGAGRRAADLRRQRRLRAPGPREGPPCRRARSRARRHAERPPGDGAA